MANRREWATLASGVFAVSVATLALHPLGAGHPTTAALTFVLIVLFVSAAGVLWTALATSAAAILSFNYFFLPPVGTWNIAGPENWVALLALVATAVVASRLSSGMRERANEAVAGRLELSRLFELSRDMLMVDEEHALLPSLSRRIATRFAIERVTLAVPGAAGTWQLFEGGATPGTPDPVDLRAAVDHDHQIEAGDLTLASLLVGERRVGVLAISRGGVAPPSLEAIAGIAAIAVERSELMSARRAAELARERADLASALLASLGHDLRTPLTALRVALANVAADALDETARRQQASLASDQAARLSVTFDKILDMARIETHSIRAQRAWSSPAEIVDAALAHAGLSGRSHPIALDVESEVEVELDPSLTAAALSHLIENAARYSPEGSAVEVRAWTDAEGFRASVSDAGPGLDDAELDAVFAPLFRGRASHTTSGTGMGLSITRGLLAAEGGRAWAEHRAPRGARFAIAVPAPIRRPHEVLTS